MKENFFDTRQICPTCESKHTEEIYRAKFTEPPISTYLDNFYNPQGGVEFSYLEGESYILNKCNDCTLVYQKSIPNDFLMKKLYEEWIDPELVHNHRENNLKVNHHSILAREIEMVIKYFNRPTKELEFFDFGSGWGDWCRLAKGYGCSAVGTELSQSRIDHSRNIGISIITYDEISKYHFDFINTEQVFEHIPQPLDTLKYLAQSLKPGGVIKISVPNGDDIKRLLSVMDWNAPKNTRNSLNPIAPLEHINCYSKTSIYKMAEKTNLSPITLQVKGNPKLLDYSIRDILRPFYHLIKTGKILNTPLSNNLFFRKDF